MPPILTSTGLVASVRRNASLGPENNNAFPFDSDILAWINEEMTNACVTVLMKPREEFFVEYYEFTTTADVREYRIPAASFASDVRDVQAQFGSEPYQSLSRIEPELVAGYDLSGASSPYPSGYYLRGNYVVLVPMPAAGSAIRIKYFRRPGYIVTSSSYSLVTNLSGSAPTYTATVASTTGLSGVTEFEFAESAAPFETVLTGVVGVVAGGTTLTLTLTAAQAAKITASLSECYALAAGNAPGPQIPQDLVSYLTQRTTWRGLIAKGDKDGAKACFAASEITRQALVNAMNARTGGLSRKVVGRSFNRRWGGFFGNWGG